MKWTKENLKTLEKMVNQGYNNGQIALHFNVKNQCIAQAKHKYNIKSDDKPNKYTKYYNKIKWNQKRLKELNTMFSNPYISLEEISEHFGTSIENIRCQATKNLMVRGKFEDEGKRQCTVCGKLYPATTQYFHKCTKIKIGLKAHCIECAKEKHRKYINNKKIIDNK